MAEAAAANNGHNGHVGNAGYCPPSDWPLHVPSEADEIIREDEPLPNTDTLHELPTGTAYAKTLRSRSKKLGKSPYIQASGPIKAARASKQYIYDDKGQEYLDCINATAHVGHCHPQVVSSGYAQLSRLSTAQGFQTPSLANYVKELVNTLPDRLNICFMCNSGSEANDLSLRLARQFTGANDVLVHEDTYHGNLGVLVDISPKVHSQIPQYKQKDWVHVLPVPDVYTGKFQSETRDQAEVEAVMDRYLEDTLKELSDMKAKGVKLAALIMDTFLVIPGLHKPSKKYMQSLFVAVRQMGGLVIIDEVQTGLGRCGDSFWGFQNFGVVPDIITVGKPLGSGHPIGAVFCSKEVSDTLGGYFSTFGGNPVSCAIGMATLNVIHNEKLMLSAENVGRLHGNMLKDVMNKFPGMLGDVRGQGLMWILEFISDSRLRQPNPELARNVMFGLRSKHILVGITGKWKNMIVFTPPMCFTITNSRRFGTALKEVLTECAAAASAFDGLSIIQEPQEPSTSLQIPNYRKRNHEDLKKNSLDDECSDEESPQVSSSEEDLKRAKLELEDYEQID